MRICFASVVIVHCNYAFWRFFFFSLSAFAQNEINAVTFYDAIMMFLPFDATPFIIAL